MHCPRLSTPNLVKKQSGQSELFSDKPKIMQKLARTKTHWSAHANTHARTGETHRTGGRAGSPAQSLEARRSFACPFIHSDRTLSQSRLRRPPANSLNMLNGAVRCFLFHINTYFYYENLCGNYF